MTKSKSVTVDAIKIHLKLPNGEIITPGPGTVPTAESSIEKTSIQKMIKAAKAASKAGIFDKEEDYGIYISSPAK